MQDSELRKKLISHIESANNQQLEILNEFLNNRDTEVIVAHTVDGITLTNESYNESLKIAENEISTGNTISAEDLESESLNW